MRYLCLMFSPFSFIGLFVIIDLPIGNHEQAVEIMQEARICLALSDIREMRSIKNFLTVNGLVVVSESDDGASAVRHIRTLRPDLVIVDDDLPVINGLEIAKILREDAIAPCVILKSFDHGNLWINQESHWDFVYLYRPVTKSALLQTIQLVLVNYKKIVSLEKQIQELKSNLESRKAVEKAKGIVMEKYGLSESEAYRRIQKQSMNQGIPMKKLAQDIIKAHYTKE
jgi:AmiR/NasT family two-component response regulator